MLDCAVICHIWGRKEERINNLRKAMKTYLARVWTEYVTSPSFALSEFLERSRWGLWACCWSQNRIKCTFWRPGVICNFGGNNRKIASSWTSHPKEFLPTNTDVAMDILQPIQTVKAIIRFQDEDGQVFMHVISLLRILISAVYSCQ